MVHATQTAVLEHGSEDNDTSADELVLRVCSPVRRGQLVRLKSRKCSIGSAQNCTLRLAARGVHPVHCLIVRGQEETVIRCWAPDTRINGRSFTDANLNVGDRLTIGPIEFDVLHTGTPHATAPSETQPRTDAQDQSSRLDEQLKSIREEKQSWEKDLSEQRVELDAQKVELSAQRESLQKQRDDLVKEADCLHKQRDDLVKEADCLQKQRDDLVKEADWLQKQRDDLVKEADWLRKQRQEWESARAKDVSQAADDNACLERLQAELDAQKAELAAQRESLQKQRQEWESARAKDVSQAADDNARMAKLQEELASRRTEELCAEGLRAAPLSGEAPISLENVLSQMGMEKRAAVAHPAAVADNQDKEESLDDYMARLMERVRAAGGSTPTVSDDAKSDYANAPSADTLTSASPQSISQSPTSQIASYTTEESEEQKTTGEKLKNLSPRVKAPEKVESLSAMRELANVSAQTAINRHAKRQFLHAARSKLLVAGIGLLAGGFLLSLWWFLGERGAVFYGGLIAFLIALFWGFQFAAMSGKVISTKAPAKNLTGSPSTEKNEGTPSPDYSRKSF